MNPILLYILMPAIIGISLVVVLASRYPIKVVIFEKRANGFTVKYGKAGRIKNKGSGVWEYKMNLPKFPLGEKKTTKPKPTKDQKEDILAILQSVGVQNPDKVYADIQNTKKGNVVDKKKLVIKKNNE